MKESLRRRMVLLPALVLLALIAAACGGTPTQEAQEEPEAQEAEGATEVAPPAAVASATPAGDAGDMTALEAVYQAVEGLTGEERRAALLELALQEGSELNYYTSTNVDESGPISDAFEEETGIAVNLFRASANNILQRVLQESAAGFDGADVMNSSGREMMILHDEGILAPLRTPATEGNAAVFDTWAGIYLNVYLAAWNTDLISPEEAPKTWEDVFTKYPGQMAIQFDDIEWYATLINEWFVKEKGMTEEEAVEMLKQGAAGNQVVSGHTVGAELLAAGEYAVGSSLYQHRIEQMKQEGAPVEWEPAVEPMVIRANGVGIHRDTKRPATALLYTEFLLTDAQPMLAEFERTPALRTVEGGIPEQYNPIPVDLEQLNENEEKWTALYEEMVRASGDSDIQEE